MPGRALAAPTSGTASSAYSDLMSRPKPMLLAIGASVLPKVEPTSVRRRWYS